jgi:L-malate glycosyltransferase
MRIFAFHLLNDYSGSPKVLNQLLKGWQQKGADITMVTCSGREGFLSDIPGIRYHFYWYRWAANPFVRLFNLVLSQLLLFVKLLFVVRKNDLIYINTVLPFGAAFLGKLKGCRIIYHVHETTMKPAVLKRFLFGMVKWAATDVVYVSNFLAEQEPMPGKKIHVLYNAIETQFLTQARFGRKQQLPTQKMVLMVCSLKTYKGVNEFVDLASRHPKYLFTLVVNAKQQEIDDFWSQSQLPNNLKVFPTQTNLHPFYANADVVLNLSNPQSWVETFGLTIIEGMAYGLPAIVPPVGGIAELVVEGVNGFKVDCRNSDLLSSKLTEVLENEETYNKMRAQALAKIERFSEVEFVEESWGVVNG